MKQIPALSFWQPYAWFIVNGHADVDSRTWAPQEARFGERIAVHAASRRMTKEEFAEFLVTVQERGIKNYPSGPEYFPYGAIVGTVVVDGVTRESKSYWAHSGMFHWLLSSPEKMKPRPTKGQRGWFSVLLKDEPAKPRARIPQR